MVVGRFTPGFPRHGRARASHVALGGPETAGTLFAPAHAMQRASALAFLVAAVAVGLAACGGSSTGVGPSGASSTDAGGTSPLDGSSAAEASGASGVDAGDAGPPVAHAPMPQLAYGGGGLLSAVNLVTVTWQADTENLSAPLEAFGASSVGSSWWGSVRAGYCATGGAPCVGGVTATSKQLGDLPLTPITDSAIAQTGSFRKFISDKTKAGDLPEPDGSTLYVFYLPAGMTVTVDGVASCGYHGAASVALPDAGTASVAYVVVPRCTVAGQMDADVAILAASRAIADAATDPDRAMSAAGFTLADPAWAPGGDEVGDFCDDVATEGAYTVARTWSNPSAAGGHDPCAPSPAGEVFYSVAPDVSTAPGISLAVGASATFAATAFSDGVPGSWQVTATDLASPGVLDLSVDTPTVSAGDVVNVTVKLTATPAATLAGKAYERFALISTGADGASHAWPLIVYAQ